MAMNRSTRMRQVPAQGSTGAGGGQQGSGGGGGAGGGGSNQGASRGGHLRRYGGVGMLLRHGKHFGLSAKQADKLEALRSDHELEKADLDAAVKKAKIQMRTLMRDLSADRDEVLKAIDAVATAEGALRRMRYEHLSRARGVLSSAQTTKLKRFYLDKRQEAVQAAAGLKAEYAVKGSA